MGANSDKHNNSNRLDAIAERSGLKIASTLTASCRYDRSRGTVTDETSELEMLSRPTWSKAGSNGLSLDTRFESKEALARMAT